ncbi:MAG: anthranilate synthase component I family protein [Elusimicrobiota bacterium]
MFRQTIVPLIPRDLLHFWQQIHPNPQNGFFLGGEQYSQGHRYVYCSVAEPIEIKETTTFKNPSFLIPSNNKFPYPEWVGVFSFEAGKIFEPKLISNTKLKDPYRFPVYSFARYKAGIKFDLKRKTTTLWAVGYSDQQWRKLTEKVVIPAKAGIQVATHSLNKVYSLDPGLRRGDKRKQALFFNFPLEEKFSFIVKKAQRHIAAGDIYQANLSMRFSAPFISDAVSLYRCLTHKNPSPYAALLKGSYGWIVSNSPELLIKINNKSVITRPIAGTRPRGKNKKEDLKNKGELLLSPKEKAEHIMLVDLERNDLGRVSQAGSVKVTEKMGIEYYSHVMHIVSQVEGKLKKNISALEAIKAVFPGGTITGCPKLSSIKIIQECEKEKRGPFYGSLGFFSYNGDALFNILIRSALVQKKKIHFRAGAGIVADSVAQKEYQECLAKAGALMESIGEIK